MKTLTTNRLILRALSLTDLDAFFNYCKKPNIGPNAGWRPHHDLYESSRILEMMIKENEVWGITLKEKDELIGTIGLHVRTFENALANRKEIGYVLDDIYWGKGIMTEAVNAVIAFSFKELELDEILCGHSLTNLQSRRVIEKSGFSPTHIEQRDHFDGSKIDIQMYVYKKEDDEEKNK